MSNTIANYLYIYGPQDRVGRVSGGLLAGWIECPCTIPPSAEPSEDPSTNRRSQQEQIHVDYWGAFWIRPDVYSDLRRRVWRLDAHEGNDRSVRTPNSFNLGNVRRLDLGDRSKPGEPAYFKYFRRPEWASWSELPGCVLPSKEDAIAYCKFYSPWSPPFRWFGKVATDLYAGGLRFVMNSIDLIKAGNDGSHEIIEHWSVDGPGEFYQGGHCLCCIEAIDGTDEDDDEEPWEMDESAEMVQQVEHEMKLYCLHANVAESLKVIPIPLQNPQRVIDGLVCETCYSEKYLKGKLEVFDLCQQIITSNGVFPPDSIEQDD